MLAQHQKALDDVAEIFIKTVRNLEHTTKLRLQQYQFAHADQLQSVVSQFRNILNVPHACGRAYRSDACRIA